MSSARPEKYQNHHNAALEYKKIGVEKLDAGLSKDALAKYNRAITELNQIPHEHHDSNDHRLLSHCYYGKSVGHHNLGNKTEALEFFEKALKELNSIPKLNDEDKKFFSKVESWKENVIDVYIKEMLPQNKKKSAKLKVSGIPSAHFEQSKLRDAQAKREGATQSGYSLRHTRRRTR